MRLGLRTVGFVLAGLSAAAACSSKGDGTGGTGGGTASAGSSGTTQAGTSGNGGAGGVAGNSGKGGSGGTGGASGGSAGSSNPSAGKGGGSAGTDNGEAGEASASGGRAGSAGNGGRGGSDAGGGGTSAGSGGSDAGSGGTGGISPMCELTAELIGSCLIPETMSGTACNEYFEGAGITEDLIVGVCEPNGGVYSTDPCPDTSLEDTPVLGCCSTIGGFNRNCYYGAESDRARYEQLCDLSGCPLLEE